MERLVVLSRYISYYQGGIHLSGYNEWILLFVTEEGSQIRLGSVEQHFYPQTHYNAIVDQWGDNPFGRVGHCFPDYETLEEALTVVYMKSMEA